MPSFSLLLLVLTSVPTPTGNLAMPPPPPGMKVLGTDDKQLLLGSASLQESEGSDAEGADAPEEPDAEQDAAAAELEAMRALEDATLDPGARPDAEVLQSLRRLGLANPLRLRMLDALEEPNFREDEEPGELPRITDLSRFDAALVQERYDIPVEMQPLVAQYIQFFQGPGRKWFAKWVSRSTRYIPLMQPILESHGLPRDTVYLAMIESGFSAHAYSWAHASGPWQFISSTGKQYGLHQDFWVDERRDPIKATHAAARYLKDLHRELGHWYLAWAGYNTGSGRVRRLMERLETKDFWTISAATDKGSLATETKHYVPKLIAAALIAKHPAAFGFSEEEFSYEQTMAYDEVKIPDATDLDVIAKAAEVSVDALQELNPELRRWCTPPASARNPYVLRLPKGTAPRFAENFARIAPKERLTFRVHKVKRGDTLSQIAEKYGSAAEAILQMNRLKNVRTLKLNTELVIPVAASRAGKAEDGALARKVAQARRSGVTVRPEDEVPAGTRTSTPTAAGTVKKERIGNKERISYTLQAGDSLWTVAQRFQVSVEDVKRWNGVTSRRRALKLQIGSVVYVWPESGATTQVAERAGTVIAQRAPAGNPGSPKRVHELAAGETLWSIAQRYGVSVEDIKRWNNIKNTNTLPTGMRLTVTKP